MVAWTIKLYLHVFVDLICFLSKRGEKNKKVLPKKRNAFSWALEVNTGLQDREDAERQQDVKLRLCLDAVLLFAELGTYRKAREYWAYCGTAQMVLVIIVPTLPILKAQPAVSYTKPQEPLTMVTMCYRDGSQPLGTKGFPYEPANSAPHHFLFAWLKQKSTASSLATRPVNTFQRGQRSTWPLWWAACPLEELHAWPAPVL